MIQNIVYQVVIYQAGRPRDEVAQLIFAKISAAKRRRLEDCYLFQSGLKELLNLIIRDDIKIVVEVGMIGTGYYHKAFVFTF